VITGASTTIKNAASKPFSLKPNRAEINEMDCVDVETQMLDTMKSS
jgi:hypothetical protein